MQCDVASSWDGTFGILGSFNEDIVVATFQVAYPEFAWNTRNFWNQENFKSRKPVSHNILEV
jgi:hypothetical protein